jgi:hypothetical protein
MLVGQVIPFDLLAVLYLGGCSCIVLGDTGGCEEWPAHIL